MLNDILANILPYWNGLWTILEPVLTAVGAFALIATQTPNKVDNEMAQKLMDFINFFGANLGTARNRKKG